MINNELNKNGSPNPAINKISRKDIAVIGMAVNLSIADTIEQYWENLENGVNAISNIPEQRKVDVLKYLVHCNQDIADVRFSPAAYLENIDTFDYKFFGITPKEASLMDPNHRIFLETVWRAIEDSGYIDKIRGSNTGVYLGYTGENEYSKLISNVEPSFLQLSVPGNCVPLISGRVSYLLDLSGPNMVINTVCSSSLVAVHLACKSLYNKECDMAIAGGVQLYCLPMAQLRLGIQSSDFLTKAFDDRSDGTGTGEGAGAIILKPLSKALQDNDHIYAIIKGSAINHDGNSIGISAPNPEAQENVITDAWNSAGINPETISYIEAHGTGTRLGDPIEVDGINRAFSRYTNKKQFCAISTVKSNIGHLDSAAGIAGIIKAILSLNQKKLAPSLHFSIPNSKIKFYDSPVYVNDILRDWDVDFPARCGVSSFGFSGTNCHVVLEQYQNAKTTKKDANSQLNIFTISAKNINTLLQLIQDYIDFLKQKKEITIEDVCYTSVVGRAHYNLRLITIVRSMDDLIAKLEKVLTAGCCRVLDDDIYFGLFHVLNKNPQEIENCYTESQIEEFSQSAGNLLDSYLDKNENVTLHELLQLYTKGASVKWEKLYTKEYGKIIHLPLYPFMKSRCWIDLSHVDPDKTTPNKPVRSEKVIPEIQVTNFESYVLTTIQEVIGETGITKTDDFYDIGGDSISAINVVNLINKEYNINSDVSLLLEHPVIETYASKLQEKYLKIEEQNVYSSIAKIPKRKYYPLTSAQKRMYILNQVDSKSLSYNMPSAMLIKGELDCNRLEKGFNLVLDRHASLRTSFELMENEPVQRVNEQVDFKIKYQEINGRRIESLIEDFIKPFNLSEAPLLRIALIKLSQNEHLLLTDMHHIISDGISINNLIRDFIAAYENKQSAPLELQYVDYAVWYQNFIRTDYFKNQEKYWLNVYSENVPVLDLPTDFVRPRYQLYEGDSVDFEIELELKHKLKEITHQANTTLFVLLFTIYKVLLYRYSNSEDFAVGIAVSGRPHVNLHDIVGMFVNSLAIRNKIDGMKKFTSFLLDMKDVILESFKNQDYPLEMLVEKSGIKDLSRNPVFDTMFVMHNMGYETLKIKGLEFEPYPIKENNSKLDIMLTAYEADDAVKMNFNYCTKLFRESTIRKFARDYLEVCHAITDNPHVLIKDIQLTTEVVLPQESRLNIDFDF